MHFLFLQNNGDTKPSDTEHLVLLSSAGNHCLNTCLCWFGLVLVVFLVEV